MTRGFFHYFSSFTHTRYVLFKVFNMNRLSKDPNWGVRKACIDTACRIAEICDGASRETHLTEVFLRFLEDASKWVKVAAYKNLGPFIATLMGQKIHAKLIENYLKMAHPSINNLSIDNDVIPWNSALKIITIILNIRSCLTVRLTSQLCCILSEVQSGMSFLSCSKSS